MRIFRPDNFSVSTVSYKRMAGGKKIFNEMLKKYFSNFKIIEIFQLDRAEINSQNYKIILEVGGKRNIYLLRQYRVLSDKKQIEFYLQFLNDLHDRGLLVSQPIITLKNKFSVQVDNKIYSLFVFIDGSYFVPNNRSLAAVAKSIAQIHKGFSVLKNKYVSGIRRFSKKGYTYFNKIIQYSANDFESIFKIIENKDSKTPVDKTVLLARELIYINLKQVAGLKKEKALPLQIIHSDLHPHNILMKNNEVVSVLDFDAVRISEQARDTAFALFRFGRQLLLKKNLRQVQINAPKIRNLFLESYAQVNRLTQKEIDMMPLLLKDEILRKLLFVLNGVYKERNLIWANDLTKFINSLNEINYFWP